MECECPGLQAGSSAAAAQLVIKQSSPNIAVPCLADLAVEVYGARLHRYLLARMAPGGVDDLVQEVYLRLLRRPSEELVRNPERYIFTVAQHVLWEFGRRERRQRATVHVVSEAVERLKKSSEQLGSDEPAHWASSAEVLQSFFAKLPPEQQASLLLHLDGVSFREIAGKLDVSERAARRYVGKARDSLRRTLAAEMNTGTTKQAG